MYSTYTNFKILKILFHFCILYLNGKERQKFNMNLTSKDKEGREKKKDRKQTSKQYSANFYHNIHKGGYHSLVIHAETTHLLERILMGTYLFADSMPFIFMYDLY